MITELPESSGANIGFLIKGKLTDDDYKQHLIPAMEEAINAHEKIRILFQIEKIEGITVHGAWDDFMIWPKLQSAERMAILIDENGSEFTAKFIQLYSNITHIEVKFFMLEQVPKAWEWLKAA